MIISSPFFGSDDRRTNIDFASCHHDFTNDIEIFLQSPKTKDVVEFDVAKFMQRHHGESSRTNAMYDKGLKAAGVEQRSLFHQQFIVSDVERIKHRVINILKIAENEGDTLKAIVGGWSLSTSLFLCAYFGLGVRRELFCPPVQEIQDEGALRMYQARLDQYRELSRRLDEVSAKCQRIVSELNFDAEEKQKRLEQKKVQYKAKNNAKKVSKRRKKRDAKNSTLNEMTDEAKESDEKEEEADNEAHSAGIKRKNDGKAEISPPAAKKRRIGEQC